MGSLLSMFATVGEWVSGGGSAQAGCVRGGCRPTGSRMADVVLFWDWDWDIPELIDSESCASFLRFRSVGAVEGSKLASEESSLA